MGAMEDLEGKLQKCNINDCCLDELCRLLAKASVPPTMIEFKPMITGHFFTQADYNRLVQIVQTELNLEVTFLHHAVIVDPDHPGAYRVCIRTSNGADHMCTIHPQRGVLSHTWVHGVFYYTPDRYNHL